MDMETAKKSIGKMVMSRDAGFKMIEKVHTPHGPYKLLGINRHGLAILEGRENRVKTSLLALVEDNAKS